MSPFGRHPKGLFSFQHFKLKIMKTLNSIAVEYLLRNDSQNDNNKSENLTKEITRINSEQDRKVQKSLLFQMYDLETEGEFSFA
jgi:hypothetical protein